MDRYILLIFFLLLSTVGFSQHKFWVQFCDKGDVSMYEIEDILSPKAIDRRKKIGIGMDHTDFPVNRFYTQTIQKLGVPVHVTSRWLNAISVTASPGDLEKIAALPFVQHIRPVWQSQTASTTCNDPLEDIDTYRIQLSMVGLDDLHANGFTGKGITIAVLDNGFRGGDTTRSLQHIFQPEAPTSKDFVEIGHDVYDDCKGSCTHGTNVLSILASRKASELIGSAPDAHFILIRTENDQSETHQEEDNWLAGAELADSLGADIISSSLSYKEFDAGEGDYSSADLDGNTALVTLAADMAAAKGILVVNSAGNSGQRGIWAPADGNDVLAVGSVKQDRLISSFSSVGPTADGRIKPDLVAMGEATFVLGTNGAVYRGSGTSFSCPIISGLAACLMQSAGYESTSTEIFQAMIQSGDRYTVPDNSYGNGIPNGNTAYQLLTGNTLRERPCLDRLLEDQIVVYPTPSLGRDVWIGVFNPGEPYVAKIELNDATGRRVDIFEGNINSEYNTFVLPSSLLPGLYVVRVVLENGESITKKVVL